MRINLHSVRTIFIGVLAGGIMASCSQKTAYTGASANTFATAQQYKKTQVIAENEPEKTVAIAETPNAVATAETESPSANNSKAESKALNKKVVVKQKFASTQKMLKNAKKSVASAVYKNIPHAYSTAAMGEGDGNALVTVGVIFLMLGILGFIIPPLFFIGFNATAASMLVIVTIAVAAFGLMLLAFGLAKNNETK